MAGWIDVNERLPAEQELVVVRVRGTVRQDYYRIDERWYALEDLDRWRMNTSRFWPLDRSWYVETEQIDGWRGQEGAASP